MAGGLERALADAMEPRKIITPSFMEDTGEWIGRRLKRRRWWSGVKVSMAFLGHEREERQHWKKALQYDPSLRVAQENLADLQALVEALCGPWAFRVTGYWVPEKLIQEMAATLPVARRNVKDEAIQAVGVRFLRNHPKLLSLVLLMLARVGPDVQEFFVSLAMLAENHEMISALRDFVLGDYGADDLRTKAAEGLSA